MKFPYLHYEVYKKCPLAYKWRFVERPAERIIYNPKNAFIGLVLQKLVERFYKEKWWEEEFLKEKWRNAVPIVSSQFTDSEKIKWNPGELEEWLRVAHETIDPIVKVIRSEKLIADPSKNKLDENLVEFEVELPVGGDDALQSRIDFLIRRADVLTLLDGKGGKTVGKYVDKDQLYFYSAMTRKLFGRLPHRTGFWWFRHETIQWIAVTNDVVDKVIETAKTFMANIRKGLFDPTPGTQCRLCDFRSICEAGQRHLNRNHISAPVDIPSNFGEVPF